MRYQARFKLWQTIVMTLMLETRDYSAVHVACQRDGLWREFCDRVTVGDCWRGGLAGRAECAA